MWVAQGPTAKAWHRIFPPRTVLAAAQGEQPSFLVL